MSDKESNDKNKLLSNIDLIHHLLNNGLVCYVPEEFDIEPFIDRLMEWMIQQNLEAQYTKEDQLHIINYIHKSGITNTIGLSMNFRFFALIDQGKLFFDLKPQKWFENKDSGFSLSKLVNDPRDKEITKFLYDYIISITSRQNDLKADLRNLYIEKLNDQRKIWFFTRLLPEDILLVFLEISAIKMNNGQLNEEKDLQWFFFVSSLSSGLLAFDKREQMIQQFPIKANSLKVKNELGRNPVFINDNKLLATRMNSELFYYTQHLYLLDPNEKTREIIRLNWLYKEKHESSNQFAIDFQHLLVTQTGDPFDELSLFYMRYTGGNREKVFLDYAKDEKLLGLLHQILDHSDTYDIITQWITKWNISYLDSVALNSILIKGVENAVHANNILPFYRHIRENFLKKNNETVNAIIFDLGFSKHLIKCGLSTEAKKTLTKCLEKLPDETILDLLPSKDVDLTGTSAGQIIKVQILEILSGIEIEKEANNLKCQIARLQPLVEERIENLIQIKDSEISTKAEEVKKILSPGNLIANLIFKQAYHYKLLDKSLIDKNIKHPASRKDGGFSNFQKWLASAKIPDLNLIKSYTEKLSVQKHPELNTVITDIRYALNLENLEVYISQGDKSIGITSYESTPQFLIVGGEHLDKNSPVYLNHNELRFAIGVELAHLYFKHSRITSTDVWRGAFEKGYFIVDSLLSIFPAVGMFSKSLQTIGKLKQISSFLQKTEKIGRVSSRSKDILKNSEQIVNIYKSKFSDSKNADEKNMEMLATSRIMQLTAHRCGLIFTKDLRSAVRAMFLVSPKFYTELPVIEKYGLKDYLLRKNEEGEFVHQNFAISLADLFSFYLSEEYENSVKNLEIK